MICLISSCAWTRFSDLSMPLLPWRPKLSLFSSRYSRTIHRTRRSHSLDHTYFKFLWIPAALNSLRRKISITKYCLSLEYSITLIIAWLDELIYVKMLINVRVYFLISLFRFLFISHNLTTMCFFSFFSKTAIFSRTAYIMGIIPFTS